MIYAFTGKKGSGKSTACAFIAQELDATQLNFKGALVAELEQNFPDLVQAIITVMEKNEWDGKRWTFKRLVNEKPPLFRTLMQNYGTEVRRRDNTDYWVNQWKKSAQLYPTVIVDDVRFRNEAQAVKDLGGVVIRLERPDLVSTDMHQSETEMNELAVDYTITTVAGEHRKLQEAVKQILHEKRT